jgi:hypothetical protein
MQKKEPLCLRICDMCLGPVLDQAGELIIHLLWHGLTALLHALAALFGGR